MNQGMELPPAVVVGVEEEGLGEEEQHVREKRGREHAHQVVRELRIQRDEHERQERPEGRGEREGDGEELRELVREPVVSRVSGLVADHLDDDGEERNGKDEGREQQVKLRDRPDGHAAPDDGEGSVLGLLVDLRLGPRLRVGPLVSQSRGAGRRVHGRGRGSGKAPCTRGSSATRPSTTTAANITRAATGPRMNCSLRFFARFIDAVGHAASLTWCPRACPPLSGARRGGRRRRRARPRRVPAGRAGALARRRQSPTCPQGGSASGTQASAPSRS